MFRIGVPDHADMGHQSAGGSGSGCPRIGGLDHARVVVQDFHFNVGLQRGRRLLAPHRAGWVSTLLLERLRNAVQPPGSEAHPQSAENSWSAGSLRRGKAVRKGSERGQGTAVTVHGKAVKQKVRQWRAKGQKENAAKRSRKRLANTQEKEAKYKGSERHLGSSLAV